MMVEAMGASVIATNNQMTKLATIVARQSDNSSNSGYPALRPKKDMVKVTAESARALMMELSQFDVDLNALGLHVLSEAAYRQRRSVAVGKAFGCH